MKSVTPYRSCDDNETNERMNHAGTNECPTHHTHKCYLKDQNILGYIYTGGNCI
jgi:hypothetical protein